MAAQATRQQRRPPAELLPRWLQRTAAYCAAALLVSGVLWLVVALLSRVALLTVALGAALLATALLEPLHRRLHGLGLPAGLAALASTLLLVSAPLGVGLLLYARVTARLSDVGQALTQGIDRVRTWLVGGPLHLDPAQVDGLRDTVVERVQSTLPGAVTSTTMALRGLGVAFFVAFAVFFLLKDGPRMWGWTVSGATTGAAPGARGQVDAAGRAAWGALGGYVRGVVVIAVLDALFIGTALLLLGVPLWLSLTLLTFLAAFVPYLGAMVAGVVAVLVTLVTQGAEDALVVAVVVVVVQQVEGNVLQPLVMERALRLHPLVVLTSVTAGGLLFGVAGAAAAVPLVAAVTRAMSAVRGDRPGELTAVSAGDEPEGLLGPDGGGAPAVGYSGSSPGRDMR